MRSAETSGVGMKGFGLPSSRPKIFARLGGIFASAAGVVVERISPITLAVALTALVAASVYVISDAARTAAEAGSDPSQATRTGSAGRKPLGSSPTTSRPWPCNWPNRRAISSRA